MMKVSEENIELVKRTMGQALIVVMGLLVCATLVHAKDGPVAMSEIGIAATSNIVEVPEYVANPAPDPSGTPTPQAKLEYEPVTDELPILEDRKRAAEEVNGSHYESGTDQHIAPDSQIVPTGEKIEELDTAPISASL